MLRIGRKAIRALLAPLGERAEAPPLHDLALARTHITGMLWACRSPSDRAAIARAARVINWLARRYDIDQGWP